MIFVLHVTFPPPPQKKISRTTFPNGGIPQGTIFRMNDFLVQVNDMRYTVWLYNYMYVDDGTWFAICFEFGDSHTQDSTHDIFAWSDTNQMKLNSQKTKEMIICFCRNDDHHGSTPNIAIYGSVVDRVTEVNILGVTVSLDLIWNRHVR